MQRGLPAFNGSSWHSGSVINRPEAAWAGTVEIPGRGTKVGQGVGSSLLHTLS